MYLKGEERPDSLIPEVALICLIYFQFPLSHSRIAPDNKHDFYVICFAFLPLFINVNTYISTLYISFYPSHSCQAALKQDITCRQEVITRQGSPIDYRPSTN